MSDFIDSFMELTTDALSPEIFRRWSAISMLGGALERRVWIKNGSKIAFPNLYVLLVAPPGVGKYIIEDVRELWSATCQPGTKIPAFHVAPDSMTKAALVDRLAKSTTTFLGTGSVPLKYNSLLVAAEEFSILLPAYDLEYIGTLNGIFNNKSEHVEERRHGPSRELRIVNPQLNILGGAQPAWLQNLFPEEAWSTGLGRRLIMIYASETPHRSLFHESDIDPELKPQILSRLSQTASLYGQMKWTEDAMKRIDLWHLGGAQPVPNHPKLSSYNKSRSLFALKLSLISSVSRSSELIIRDVDVDRALGWLLDAERLMPDIFRAMLGKSDRDVIRELHLVMWGKWTENQRLVGRPNIKGEFMRQFLIERVPHEKVASIIKASEDAKIIDRIGGTEDDWKPRPMYGNGVQ